MSAKIPDAVYGSTGSRSHVVYLETDKNRTMVTQTAAKYSEGPKDMRLAFCLLTIGMTGMVFIIGCAATGCYASNLDPAQKNGCNGICSSSFTLASAGAAIIGTIGACASCIFGSRKSSS